MNMSGQSEAAGERGAMCIRALAVGTQSMGALAAGAIGSRRVGFWCRRDRMPRDWARENQTARDRRTRGRSSSRHRFARDALMR